MYGYLTNIIARTIFFFFDKEGVTQIQTVPH